MTGPTFSYASYASFVDRSLFMSQKGKETVIRMPKGRYRKAGKRVAIAAFYLALYALYGGQFSYTRLNEADVQSKSFLWK
jgi:lysophospholipid acyltransferase